ncbi:MAG: ERCC4 domain-containing protein [Candidatus Eremiobacteraeota bacterium]|nr:ERCC4 domain-containing protein [Candidatus Eremiobacteraeota bacterium]
MLDVFIVARNPELDSSLPYLLHLPLEGGTWLKARETWPRASRVYCHATEPADVAQLEVLERIAVLSCERRGPVVDLLLDRAQNRRAQFVFTHVRGRPSIFWQTAKAMANARPGLRVPQRRSRTIERIVIDTRERYGYGFKRFGIALERAALLAGDYAAFVDGGAVATAIVERKAMDDFCTSLVDGTLGFVMAELARSPSTAVVVEGTYSQLLRRQYVDGAWLAELLVRLQVRYPSVIVVFAETRTLGERWTYDFFAAAAAEDAPRTSREPASVTALEPPKKRVRKMRKTPEPDGTDETSQRS